MLHPAFLRTSDTRNYIQHHTTVVGARIWRHLNERNGGIYVCGSTDHLTKDIIATMLRIFEQAGGISPDSARSYFRDLISAGRYIECAWWISHYLGLAERILF
ncbi:hypothetical protein GQ54DRAFT_312183 [Martensiomyces pterosporus]|nr:hypothetical protein GQ54DRAFT_312183 [Martensiomyces pterosporus]